MWRMGDGQLPRNKRLFQWKVIIVLFLDEIAEIIKQYQNPEGCMIKRPAFEITGIVGIQ